jgi:hypothetical protein
VPIAFSINLESKPNRNPWRKCLLRLHLERLLRVKFCFKENDEPEPKGSCIQQKRCLAAPERVPALRCSVARLRRRSLGSVEVRHSLFLGRPMHEGQTAQLEKWIILLRAGDHSARDQLVKCARDRLLRLTRKMLKSYPGVARWEQTGDVFQNAALRLCRALNETTPESAKYFLNLAALHIRRELIDLARHHFGPEGIGAHHDTNKEQQESHAAGD